MFLGKKEEALPKDDELERKKIENDIKYEKLIDFLISNSLDSIHKRALYEKYQSLKKLKAFMADQINQVYAVPNNGQGNCLFYSLSQYLYGDEDNHMKIRRNLTNFVSDDHFKAVKKTVDGTYSRVKYKTASDYRAIMGTEYEFGSEFELQSFVSLYDVGAIIYYEEQDEKGRLTGFLKKRGTLYSKSRNKLVELLFSGNEKCGHWELLIRNEYIPIYKESCSSQTQGLFIIF